MERYRSSMVKTKSLGSEILDRIASIKPEIAKEIADKCPTDPDEFLAWMYSEACNCVNCSLSDSRNFVVKPDGVASAQIMVVGEGPGFMEDLTATPLVGPLELRGSHCACCAKSVSCFDHRYLNHPTQWGKKRRAVVCDEEPTDSITLPDRFYLRSAGATIDGILLHCWEGRFVRHNWKKLRSDLPDSPFFITNSTLCRSWDTLTLADVSPTNTQRQACRKWFIMQWAAVNPKIILALGRPALGTILHSDKAADSWKQGQIGNTPFGPVIFSFHPTYYGRMHQKNKRALGYGKVQRAIEMALKYCNLLEED